MKAVCWRGKHDVAVETVPDPKPLNPRDAIVRITSTAICGSDLHLYDGYVPTMKGGDILGHEFMGEIVEVGKGVTHLRTGDRVVVPFTISCGSCFFCKKTLYSACDNTNPNSRVAEGFYGYSGAGLFGFSHMLGGYAGGQAEYARVPFADVGLLKVPNHLSDEQVLFLSDIFPTGYMAAENCNIERGDTVAVWGCGPVGLFTIKSCFLLGAERVLAIDPVAGRRARAEQAGAIAINPDEVDVLAWLDHQTAGRGPDSCIDAVGLEAHGVGIVPFVDKLKVKVGVGTDRPNVLRQAIMACRKAGTVSIPGLYAGYLDKIPFGAAFGKGLTMKMGQTHVQRYLEPLLGRIERGEIDPSFVVTHRFKLTDAPDAYDHFLNHQDEFGKVVLKP